MSRIPTDLNEMRERASLMISEMDLSAYLDDENKGQRDDDGLFAYIDNGVVIRTRYTCRVFTKWPEIEMYLEMIHDLDEQGITDARQFDDAEFERRLARRKEWNHDSGKS